MIKNKKILITGSSSGIGKFIARELSKKNIVIGVSRRKIKVPFANFITDLNSYSEIDKLVYKIKRKYKKIDLLINCAGITIEGHQISNFNKNIQTNLVSVFYLSSKIKNYLSKNSSIINISSIAGHLAFPNNPGYNCSKAALNMLTKSLALDYINKKIRVNTLSLGYFKTPMTIKSFKVSKKRKIRSERSIVKRWGKPKDIISSINYLSDKSSSFITGQEIILDGGWTVKGF